MRWASLCTTLLKERGYGGTTGINAFWGSHPAEIQAQDCFRKYSWSCFQWLLKKLLLCWKQHLLCTGQLHRCKETMRQARRKIYHRDPANGLVQTVIARPQSRISDNWISVAPLLLLQLDRHMYFWKLDNFMTHFVINLKEKSITSFRI